MLEDPGDSITGSMFGIATSSEVSLQLEKIHFLADSNRLSPGRVPMNEVPSLTIAKISPCLCHASLIRRFGAQNIDLVSDSGTLRHQCLNNSSTYNGPTPLTKR